MRKFLEKKIGEPIAILCARYWYRGIIASIEDTYVVLRDPFMVTETGPFTAQNPLHEDSLPSDVAISYGAIEVIEQPTWCFAGYGHEGEGKQKTGRK